ncbi:AfsR/SARP family transcriptional regulator [Virgisporangium aurantiacum]|nr:AfsR/SARP family transcriptional regulator [Virgisporangium aurantiacum]
MQRRVLALLLLEANRGVRVDRLVEELWGDRPPVSARTTLQTYIYHLRRLFRGALIGRTGEDLLVTRPFGYELRLAVEDEFDVHEFEQLLARAKTMREHGLLEDASHQLREALDLWTGEPLADIDAGPLLAAAATRLEESRKAALELRIDIDLQLGRHHEVVSELSSLVNTDAAHEGFVSKLMVALVRSGRRAEALDVYQRARAQLIGEYGLEPSGSTRQLHHAILNDESGLSVGPTGPAAGAPTRVVPAQLLPDIADFVDGCGDLVRVRGWLESREAETGREPRSAPHVVGVLGPPGVGKTTSALHLAHQVRHLFPDGQLYENLDGLDDHPDSIAQTLARLLRSCGVPTDVSPTGLVELSNTFRTWTADRSVLVVLDNARSAAQVRALHPAGPACALVVTSRTNLVSSIPGVATVSLTGMDVDDALTLLGRVIGEHRVAAEPQAARRLVLMCDGLPLAVRAVGVRLVNRPHWSLQHFADRLAVAENRVIELGPGGASLLASVEASLAQLTDVTRQSFYTVIARGLTRLTAGAMSGIVKVGRSTAETILEQLVDAHLVIECMPAADRLRARQGEASYLVPSLLAAVVRELVNRQLYVA